MKNKSALLMLLFLKPFRKILFLVVLLIILLIVVIVKVVTPDHISERDAQEILSDRSMLPPPEVVPSQPAPQATPHQ